MGAKLHQLSPGWLVFHCPGCRCSHSFTVAPLPGPPLWTWNGSMDRPTFSPSLLYSESPRCHSFVRDGRIEYLSDSEHALAGQTVDLPDWEAT